jgi:hypothetical protein
MQSAADLPPTLGVFRRIFQFAEMFVIAHCL